ncbi:pyruvate, phosphate dikinase/phosphoenolpyruvate synthase regulator [Litorivicinus lipolyticus]|uniref:Putative phosphoenolpyruvate synthase regulatory protein n=1 Tax=Litorivicinus lipolyticus TaxID=418701 RepID=A0A5Q2Q7D3_9GAMM|nr:pyruvate, water dikinase regulatory protein [Litorivicinus lipolyticus]QGG80359.1 pyruvate, phosphate dikinase/phosphoenolpyruvate synthase regulator [Litorivicinus lipolyticus]
MNRTKRTILFISDGTGITAETLGQALLSQFDTKIDFERQTHPYVDSPDKANQVRDEINHIAGRDGVPPIVFDTLVDPQVRDIISSSNGVMMDVFQTFLKPLESALETESAYSVGMSHAVKPDNGYDLRIDAVNFALDNDDGARIRYYDQADLILIGVSRCGKTPTCLYLAMQFGIRAANYPLTEEDLDNPVLPAILKKHKSKLFGLTIDPVRLSAIREQRRPDSRYCSPHQCHFEVNEVEAIYRREGIPHIATTDQSVEEISTQVLAMSGLKRRHV